MSYCFNPNCQSPANPTGTEFCSNCSSHLFLSGSGSTSESTRYQAIKLLGQGGFGRTFLAVDENQPPSLSHCVIKQFFPQSTNPEKAAELFEQEATQLKILGKHLQIPGLLAHFEAGGQQYLVQEFIDGKNLAQELAQKGAFNESQIRQLLNDLLPVLHFVHKSKVIHRDIKPENIIRRTNFPQLSQLNTETEGIEKLIGFVPLFSPEFSGKSKSLSYQEWQKRGQLVLVDFGAAKKVTGNALPQTGTIIGSAAYTAPEQLMGKAIFASDIYSLGVTCIHLLTEVPPFDLFDSKEGTWVWRDYLKASVSDDLGRILDTMLQGATNRRYHGAAAVIRQLNPKPIYADKLPVASVGAIATVEKPIEVPAPPPIPLPKQNRQAEIQQILQDTLAPYNVKIQVHQRQHKLTVVINRDEKNTLYYPHLSQIIATQLTDLQLERVTLVKLLGRVNTSRVPEWQQFLKTDSKIQFRNKLIRLQNSESMQQASQIATTEFWLSKFKNKDFWIDALMFAIVSFIFGAQVIIFQPWFALIISSGFIAVKNTVSKQKNFDTNNLFANVAAIFLLVGLFDLKAWLTGTFGILLACLVIALPLFFVKEKTR